MPSVVNGINATSSAPGKVTRSKNQLRRQKLKEKKAAAPSSHVRLTYLTCWQAQELTLSWLCYVIKTNPEEPVIKREEEREVNIEYVVEQVDLQDPAFEAFSEIFAKFQVASDPSEVRGTAGLSVLLT